jgi:ABC-type branched-subunit amino acid transport system substrate-binding protein
VELTSAEIYRPAWLTGEGVPTSDLGNDGMLYLDELTGDVYQKDAGEWLIKMNLHGDDGTDGISIVWKGSLGSAPINPETNWAYYNSTEGMAYIWDGDSWEILAQDGADGDFAWPIRIGVAGPHTGDLAIYGLPSLNAARIVTNKVNSTGGINGRKIELVIADDQCDPMLAKDAAATLLDAGVIGVLGHLCSDSTREALDIYSTTMIPVISPASTNEDLTQSGKYPNFFRTIAPDDAQAKAMVDFSVEMLSLSKIAIVYEKGDSFINGERCRFPRKFLEKLRIVPYYFMQLKNNKGK